MIIYERTYPVNVFETDLTGNLSLVSMFDFFQDIAGRNASQLGFGREHLMTGGNIWVLSRMSVRIDSMPVMWSEVKLRTWPRGTDGIFAVRDFEISDADDKVLIKASSSWLVIDFQTRRLQRPDKALSELNLKFPDRRAMEENAVKVNDMPEGEARVNELTASICDLDINQHVNNAMFIKWICDTYPKEFFGTHSPVSADVNYINEAHFGDSISITTIADPADTQAFYHSVIRKDTNTELCRIRIQWTENFQQNSY